MFLIMAPPQKLVLVFCDTRKEAHTEVNVTRKRDSKILHDFSEIIKVKPKLTLSGFTISFIFDNSTEFTLVVRNRHHQPFRTKNLWGT